MEPVHEPPTDPVVRPLRGADDRLRAAAAAIVGDPGIRAGLHARTVLEQRVGERVATLDPARHALIDAYAKAATAVRDLGSLRAQRLLAVARGAVDDTHDRHRDDGAHDRRRRTGHRLVPVAVAVAAGVFESIFFARILNFVDDADTSDPIGRLQYLLSYVPGVILATSLWMAGRLLGESLARYRDQREDRSDDAPRPLWVVAVSFTAFLLVVVGWLSWARAGFLQQTQGIGAGTSAPLLVPPWSIVLLLMMVTVGAIAVNAVLHNPWADHAERVDLGLRTAARRYAAERRNADRRVAGLESAWDDLRSILVQAREEVQHVAVDRLLRVAVDASPEPPGDHDRETFGPGLPAPPVGDLLFEMGRMRDPQPGLGPLWHAEQVLVEYEPGPIVERRDRLVEQLDEQLAGERRPMEHKAEA